MRKKRKALIDNGFISSNGVCFGNDIYLRYTKPHEAAYFGIARALFALIMSFSTMIMFATFILQRPNYGAILLCCALPIGLMCVIKTKNTSIRVIGIIFLILYFLYFVYNYQQISLGFYSTIALYLEHAKQPSSMLGTSLSGINPYYYPELAAFFLQFLSSIISVIITIACMFRIDFPLLFISTFPLFELGIYHGWEAPLPALVAIIAGWIIVIALHTINQRTNKAGRRNTFAVHEKKHTYYLTSEQEKSKVFFILMRFMVILCAGVFIIIIILSNLFGHERSDTVNRYRKNINHFINNFSLEDLGGLFADYDGGLDFFGTKAVGGTNGGKLGDIDGINFNGTTALVVDTKPFEETLYLRGYVAGKYEDNHWDPIEYDDDEKFAKQLDEVNVSPQDLDYFKLTDLTNYLAVNGATGFTEEAEIDITVKGASKKYVYAPYASIFSESKQKSDYKMRPHYDSYVKLGTSEYSIKYREPTATYFDQLVYSLADKQSYFDINSTVPELAVKNYEDFVKQNYSKVTDSPGLTAAYEQIEAELQGDRTFTKVVAGIDNYFTKNGFTYTLEPGKTPSDRDFIDYFLSEQKKGYCSYYASAGAMLLRKFGYQARFVEGYVVLPSLCDKNAETCSIEVTDKCAHAWTEVYIEGLGWQKLDFTPGYENDNPNMTNEEKNPHAVEPDSSSEPDTSSSSQPDSSSEPDSSSDTSSTPDTSSSSQSSPDTSSSSSAQSSSPDNSGGTSPGNSTSSPDNSGGGTVVPGDSSGDSSVRPYPEQNGDNTFSAGKMIPAIIIIALAFFGVIMLRRILTLKTMERNCFDGSAVDRTKYMLKYSIKYLKLLDLDVSDNITDTQLCDQLHDALAEKDIHIGKELRFLFSVTQDAYMGNHEPDEEELKKAYEYLNYIAHIIVKPQLSIIKRFTTMFVNAMY